MFKHWSLRAHIMLAFLLLTLTVSGLFSLSMVQMFFFLEEKLVTQDLAHMLPLYQKNQAHWQNDPALQFFASNDIHHPIPAKFSHLKDGYNEIVDERGIFYAYKATQQDEEYIVVQEQQDFEELEEHIFNGIAAGFVFSLLPAAWLGWFLARRITTPIRRLARDVGKDPLHHTATHENYGNNEVGQLATVLNDTLEKLRQSLRRERLFTSDVSHELRTSLMVISTSCEVMLANPALQEAQRGQWSRIHGACLDMISLVETFLALAREEHQETATRAITTAECAQVQYEKWLPEFNKKGLRLELVAHVHSNTRYNQVFLETVMSNLLRNALHYTEQGHARLIVDTHGFTIEDSGVGIAAEHQALILSPFTRGPTARGNGLGLGLSLVERICQRQQWTLHITSRPQEGSIFQIRLAS